MRCPCSALRIAFCILLAVAVVSFTSCSGVSNPSSGNGGGGNGGGGNGGGGTGGGNLACSGMSTGQGASLNGFVPFTGSNLWNTDISSAPVDANSGSIITNWVGSVNVHPDWGNDPTYGIPYVVVDGKQSLVNINLKAYGDESDPGSRECSGRGRIVEHRGPTRAGGRQRKLLSLRTLQFVGQ